MRRKLFLGGLSAVLVLTCAIPVASQTTSAIVGVVKDESGAVVPGVTVEALSPALIGGADVTVSGQDGQYRIGNLSPGTYTLVFSLGGFQTLRHEGLVLTSAFTASVDVVMKVGAIDESVTVSGASPVVDLRTNVSEASITEELKQNLPTGRHIGAIVGLAMGVATAGLRGVDVAGSQAAQNVSVTVHGSRSDDTTWAFNGLEVTSANGPGNPIGGYNDGLVQEAAVITKALPAEVGGGGVLINFIHRSGSNQFHGEFFAAGTNPSFQGDNLTDELKARGLKAPTRIHKMYDLNPGFGGPLIKDRLWFYTSVRKNVIQLKLANQFNVDGSQQIDLAQNTNVSGSVTAQLNPNNRLNVVYDSAWKMNYTSQTGIGQCVPFPAIVDISATTYQPTMPKIGVVKWSSVLGKSVTMETGASAIFSTYQFQHGKYAGNDVTRIDLGLGTVWGSDSCTTFAHPSRKLASFAMSYSPSWHGIHNLRWGVQAWHTIFRQFQPTNGRGDWAWQYRNGVPVSVVVFNLPYSQRQHWNEQGLFIQDSWTIKNRLTLNLGVRYERIHGTIPAQSAPAGIWVPAREFPEIDNVPNWNTVVPRMAFVYDLTGNGKTAVKVNASRYVAKIGRSYLSSVNPANRGRSTLPWTDRNGDLIPQLDELGAGTPFTSSLQRYAADISRPYQWEFTASVQREILPSVGLTVSYFKRQYFDLLGTKNLAVPPESYIPVSITNPLTGQPITVYNQNPATLTLQDSVTDNYPEVESKYQGIEIVLDKRLSGSLTVLGGYTFGSNEGTSTTSDLNNPNLQINNYGKVGNDSTHIVNILAMYRLPGAFVLSGHSYYRSGYPLQRNYTVTRVQVPNLTQVTQNIQLQPRGEARLGGLNLVDLRLSRSFRMPSNVRFEPIVELYNLLNNNASIVENQTVGSNLGFITDSVTARVVKLAVRVGF